MTTDTVSGLDALFAPPVRAARLLRLSPDALPER
jgi:hypothetical protein